MVVNVELLRNVPSIEDFRRAQEEFEMKKRAAEQQRQMNDLEMQKAQMEIESGAAADDPANIKEWKAYQKMQPEQRREYLTMKRASQIMNLGGTQQVFDPLTGGTSSVFEVTPEPEQMPYFRADVAGSEAEAKNLQDLRFKRLEEGGKKQKQASQVLSTLNEAETLLPLATGSALGTARDIGKSIIGMSDAKTQANEKLKLYSGWLVSNVPRMEGPQSNFDVQNYKQMAADLGNTMKPIGDRMAALQGLRKLQEKYSDLNEDYAQDPLEASRAAILKKNAEGVKNPYQTLPEQDDVQLLIDRYAQ